MPTKSFTINKETTAFERGVTLTHPNLAKVFNVKIVAKLTTVCFLETRIYCSNCCSNYKEAVDDTWFDLKLRFNVLFFLQFAV